jgi:hypothetical protein
MSAGGIGIDIRLPIGLLFAIIGVILTIFGAMTNGDPIYAQHSLGINVNFWWGIVLTLFGFLMLALTWMGAKKKQP